MVGGTDEWFMEKDAEKLLEKYRVGNCTPEEKQLVERFLNQRVQRTETVPEERRMLNSLVRLNNKFQRKLHEELVGQTDTRSTTVRPIYYRVAMVAGLLLFLGLSMYLWLPNLLSDNEKESSSALQLSSQGEIAPGGHRAFLTLSDGRVVELREDQEGIVITADGMTYLDGTGIGMPATAMAENTVANITLTTPRGGTYQVTLPDGSKVRLNAASTLNYPNRFESGMDRVVELEGEGYFEVDRLSDRGLADQKFLVKTQNQVVEVLGTKFNIIAYSEEPAVLTTLAEGSVRVSLNRSDRKLGVNAIELLPGEQSIWNKQQFSKHQVDVSSVLGWTRGDIEFDQVDLETIFRQLERWYAVEFDFKDKSMDAKLYGKVSRHTHLEEILRVIESSTDLKFTIHQSPSGERRVQVY